MIDITFNVGTIGKHALTMIYLSLQKRKDYASTWAFSKAAFKLASSDLEREVRSSFPP